MPQFLLYTYMENVSVLSYSVESELGLQRKRREKCGANCFILIRFGAQSEFHDRKCIKKKEKEKEKKRIRGAISGFVRLSLLRPPPLSPFRTQ